MNISTSFFIAWIWIFAIPTFSVAQQDRSTATNVLTYQEFIGFVKQHHPLVKQANLRLDVGEAQLLKARGGFDPKIEIDYDRKKFRDTEYYDQLNTVFKIPTWYGITLEANYEQNSGVFLDPSLTVPPEGLYSAGISVSVAKGLIINERMASLKQAKLFIAQTRAERELMVNRILFEASSAYFEWAEATNEQRTYENYIRNAETRLEGIRNSVIAGDKAAIDTTEARIIYQNRRLSLEAARLKRSKKALDLSNYLWISGIPIELEETVYPEFPTASTVYNVLEITLRTNDSIEITDHPKIRALNSKIEGLKIERRLKKNNLLPDIDLAYNFLTPENDRIASLNTANYKAGFNLSFPLFLRKERGELKLTDVKLRETLFEQVSEQLALRNKIEATLIEIASIEEQVSLVTSIVEDYRRLVTAEERKFFLGESSLFLINSREQSLIEAQLKENELKTKLLEANATLYNVLGNYSDSL